MYTQFLIISIIYNSSLFYIRRIWPKKDKNDIIGYFRLKNASIDLKVDNTMYLGGFYRFPNFRPKILKIGQFLAKKLFFAKNMCYNNKLFITSHKQINT